MLAPDFSFIKSSDEPTSAGVAYLAAKSQNFRLQKGSACSGFSTRLNRWTNPFYFEDGQHLLHKAAGQGANPSTRMIFPQVTANLGVRWCSSYYEDSGSRAAYL